MELSPLARRDGRKSARLRLASVLLDASHAARRPNQIKAALRLLTALWIKYNDCEAPCEAPFAALRSNVHE